MKFFITSDIEGTNGIVSWAEAEMDSEYYHAYARRMSEEVAAVCNGINEIIPECEILVKDAHNNGRNIDHEMLPENVSLNRGWSGHPYKMMNLLDKSYDAAMMTGYHSGGGYGGHPLAHTMSMRTPTLVINGRLGSEFLMNYYTSLYLGVPVILVSGDAGLCEHVKDIDSQIVTCSTSWGLGGSVTSEHPAVSRKKLQAAAREAIEGMGSVKQDLPKRFKVEMRYREHPEAYKSSFYPGCYLVDDHTIGYETEDYFEFLRMYTFTF